MSDILLIPKTLRNNAQQIRDIRPEQQTINYYSDTWKRHLPHCEELQDICRSFPGKITRGNLFQLAACAAESRQEDDLRRLFMGTMVWGYGTTGYGPWRTARMVESPVYSRVLLKTFSLVLGGDIQRAYTTFSLNRCGPPYFTKYFYFAGRGAGLKNYPLVFDSQVYKALEYVGVDVSKTANRSGWTLDGYIRYVAALHEWAASLDCEADQIELFLFQLAGNIAG